jgi:hypothetical protein
MQAIEGFVVFGEKCVDQQRGIAEGIGRFWVNFFFGSHHSGRNCL